MNRSGMTFPLKRGAQVLYKERVCRIKKIVNLDFVTIIDSQTNVIEQVRIVDLMPITSKPAPIPKVDLNTITESAWQVAESRYQIIRPLLELKGRTLKDVEARAVEFNKHPMTLYKWIHAHESEGRVSALLTQNRNDKGTSRLPPEVDEIITSMIESEYLTRTPKSVSRICQEIRNKCEIANLPPPHCNTVRNRIDAISEELRMSKRRGKKMAAQKYSPIKGNFPGADFPLAVVEIDHTKMDIILVDDIHRRPVGRPWITLAIDVFSRMIAGLYVSFDPPGSLSTGLCMAHAILAKDKWMAKHGGVHLGRYGVCPREFI